MPAPGAGWRVPWLLFFLAAGSLAPEVASAQASRKPRLVAQPVTYYPRNYPEQKARVVLEFVVTADGRVDSTTVRVVASTDPHFNDAARLTTLALRFEPGYSQGGPVKVLVQQAITYAPRTRACSSIVTLLLEPQCADSMPVRTP